jgi:hypothetical protein
MSKTTIMLDNKLQSGEEHSHTYNECDRLSILGTANIGSLHERITSAYLGVNVPLRKAEQQY